MASKASVTTKEQLHRLIDGLSDGEAEMALRALGNQRKDPLLRVVADAPEDDEPLTPAEAAAIAEGQADIAAGRTVSLEDIERKYA